MTGDTAYARAYARALLGFAVRGGTTEGAARDMLALAEQWRGSPELRAFCRSHLPGHPENHGCLVDALWGDSLSEPARFLLRALARWNHLRLLPLVAEQYRMLDDRRLGRADVRACFACEPRPEEVERVRGLVAEASGPDMNLAVRVEPALIAGLRLFINDKRVDASLAGRLARIRHGLNRPAPLAEAAG